jgi:hypothetical protein
MQYVPAILFRFRLASLSTPLRLNCRCKVWAIRRAARRRERQDRWTCFTLACCTRRASTHAIDEQTTGSRVIDGGLHAGDIPPQLASAGCFRPFCSLHQAIMKSIPSLWAQGVCPAQERGLIGTHSKDMRQN